MRINSSVSVPSNFLCRRQPSSTRHNFNTRVPRLISCRWRKLRKGGETKRMAAYIIQMKNLKLLMENQSIIEENEKLRKKALLLHQENQILSSLLQKKLPKITSEKTKK